MCVCSDVDDPEYKPAPALIKDDMEVRSHEPGARWFPDKKKMSSLIMSH